eukprot:TRINITY_DN8353_c0_g1_i1.p1 TRINITY_DN8353_c0_g1~~TRINITY_DN8353_c0_g1_i1.p1  ORF type:complete len:217 (-),score=31.34 TRINITY_DN8353_c0_g1_i1:113-763(-)
MEDLISKIKKKLSEPNYNPDDIKSTLEQYLKSGAVDWKKYALFCPHKYARNLVEINEDFELMIICWQAGQVSPIHNHSSQNCWMSVLQGGIEEVYFKFNEDTKKLEEGDSHIYTQGMVAHIYDDLALHKVKPVNNEPAISLHVYSKPIPLCNVYCPLTDKVTKRKLGFFSQYGRKSKREFTSKCYKALNESVRNKSDVCPYFKSLLLTACQDENFG